MVLMGNDGNIDQEKKTFRNFTVMYLLALTIIAAVTVFSQVLIQNYLSNQIHDSHIINFTAKLRTYCQSISKLALLLQADNNIESNRKEFVNTLKQWEKSQEGLMNGNEFLNLPKSDEYEIKMMYDIVKQPYQEMMEASHLMIEELYAPKPFDSINVDPYVKRILDNEKAYLIGMELIVFDYDRFSRNAILRLKDVEYLLMGFVLFAILLEVFFIFAPLAKRIKRVIRGLMDSEEKTRSLAEELKQANTTLERSHQKLWETNYALEKAAFVVKTDPQGRIMHANDKYCHVSKYPLVELRGKPLFYSNNPEKESIIYEHIRSEELKREVWQGEVFDTASDGTGFWLDVTIMPILNNGEVRQYLVIAYDITNRKNTEEELKRLMEERLLIQQIEQTAISHSFVNGQEKERKRVASEIHDGIGQMLTSLRMKLEMITPDRKTSEHYNGVNLLLKSIIGETKKIIADLSPSVLNDFGLGAAIKELVKTSQLSSGTHFELNNFLNLDDIEREIQIAVYRIAQESINNVQKHAAAKTVKVTILNDEQHLHLEIADDGLGFNYDPGQFTDHEVSGRTNGLLNMKERAELLGGELTISSVIGEGTTVSLKIPV